MGKINVLSFEIANLIAAGEVVERPSSVVKELLENSIDSGATSITAEIKHGGVSLIRVSDNGCGIDKEDLPVAIKRHATSKINQKDDLESITTLGFRGEALAAIASVAKMTIITKTKAAESASMLTSEAGVVTDISEVYAADGTTVVVNDLFYNVPARRKFLKKDVTEAMNVTALIEKVALSRPDISIQFLIDGKEKFKTPGDSDLLNTIYAVFGKEFSSKLIKAEGTANGIRVHGYIGRSDNVKKNRNLMNVFINGRYVKSLTAQAAIEKAYTSFIAPEAFPTCVLFLEMNPSTVDVNVHPAKLDVKFSDERVVFESVYYTVKTALEGSEYRPEISFADKRPGKSVLDKILPSGDEVKAEQIKFGVNPTPYITEKRIANESNYNSAPKYNSNLDKTARIDIDEPLKVSSGAGFSTKRDTTPSVTPRDSVELLRKYRESVASSFDFNKQEDKVHTPETKTPVVDNTPDMTEYKYIGEAFDCYVMIEYEGAMLIIDKHAAHERIIFEDLKKSREADGRVASQLLMLPITVILSPDEQSSAKEYLDELTKIGFEYTVNEGSCDITAIPDAISAYDAETLFVKMLDELTEGRGNPGVTEAIRRERALYQVACKAAIKGGRKYDRAVIDWLICKVLTLPDITVCPHGRPIAYRLTKSELDRHFERIK